MDHLSPPDIVFGPLFEAVQAQRIFPDSKTFVDCTPEAAPGVQPLPALGTGSPARPARVLYIEDNPVNMLIVQELLQKLMSLQLGGDKRAPGKGKADDRVVVEGEDA